MHRYDARQMFVELLEGYVAGLETDERRARLCALVSSYHDPLTVDAADLVAAVLGQSRSFHGTYAEASEALRERLACGASHKSAA
jgi:hypothetical protein